MIRMLRVLLLLLLRHVFTSSQSYWCLAPGLLSTGVQAVQCSLFYLYMGMYVCMYVCMCYFSVILVLF